MDYNTLAIKTKGASERRINRMGFGLIRDTGLVAEVRGVDIGVDAGALVRPLELVKDKDGKAKSFDIKDDAGNVVGHETRTGVNKSFRQFGNRVTDMLVTAHAATVAKDIADNQAGYDKAKAVDTKAAKANVDRDDKAKADWDKANGTKAKTAKPSKAETKAAVDAATAIATAQPVA